MQKMMQRHFASSYYVITFLFSFMLLMLHFMFKTAGEYSVSFTQLAPAFAVLALALLAKDQTAIPAIKSRLAQKTSNIKWLIPALLIPLGCVAGSAYMLSCVDIAYVAWGGNALFYMLNGTALLAGCFAEEIGWRGFLLPHLQKKHSPFISSLIVGILWGVWHLNFTGGLPGFILYTLTIIEMSLLMTWLYNKTNGYLLPMIIWHFFYNLFSHVFLWERFGLKLFIVQSIVFGTACVIMLIFNRKAFFRKPLTRMATALASADEI